VPFTSDGVGRLADALAEVDVHVEQPVTVWRWHTELGQECRGTLYGWRGRGPDRVGLVVTHRWRDARGLLRDLVEWVPAALIRERRE
jgi:hypothetical protein